MKQPVEALRNLVTIVEDPEVVKNEGFVFFLLRTCKKQAVHNESLELLTRTILQVFDAAPQSVPAAVVLFVCEDLPNEQACAVLKKLYAVNSDNANVLARYLDVLADVDFSKAKELQQSQIIMQSAPQDEDLIQKLLDEGMP